MASWRPVLHVLFLTDVDLDGLDVSDILDVTFNVDR